MDKVGELLSYVMIMSMAHYDVDHFHVLGFQPTGFTSAQPHGSC